MTAPAISRAMHVYEEFKAPRSFLNDLFLHLIYGRVVSRADVFAMARPVEINAPESALADIARQFPNPDCWFIWSAAGNLRELVKLLPYPLPFIAFHRGKSAACGRLRVYDSTRFQSAIENRQSKITP